MSSVLDKIVLSKRAELSKLKTEMPLSAFEDSLARLPDSAFRAALSDPSGVRIIAEIKKGSPSRGLMAPDLDPAATAAAYASGGAAALSVLTEREFFFGDPEYLAVARRASGLPVLCKDFIIDPYQVPYAKLKGADAVLLIMSLHTRKSLAEFLSIVHSLRMDCLVEVHDEQELEDALAAGAEIIGVNNRNLADFTVSLETAEGLASEIPDEVIKVAESGIFTRADITRLQGSGYRCFLIGEALVKADDPAALLRELQS